MPDHSLVSEGTKTTVAQHFNQNVAAADYADHYSHQALDRSPWAYFYQRRRDIVIGKLQPLGARTVLDIGCGPGIFANPCVAQGLHYHGVDVSERMIDEARRRFAKVNSADFSVSDAQCLPFKDNNFDVVLCLGMLEYVPHDREIEYLKEITRVLRPGGTVVFSFLNKRSPYWLLNDHILPTFRLVLWAFKELLKRIGLKPQNDFAARAIFTRKFEFCERINFLRSLGLSATETIHFSPVIIPPRLDNCLPRLTISMTEKIERALAPNMLRWLGQAFIIVAHKGNDNHEAGLAL